MEGRKHRDTGTFEGKMAETSSSTTVSTKLERIARLAREMPPVALTTLAHHIDIDWLREAYRRTRKDGATGTDQQTADEYARNRLLAERSRRLFVWRHLPAILRFRSEVHRPQFFSRVFAIAAIESTFTLARETPY